jgi:N-acetylglucosamine-6-sulfatase
LAELIGSTVPGDRRLTVGVAIRSEETVMSRRLLLVLVSWVLSAAPVEHAAAKPSVVVIMTDDQSDGDSVAFMPNVAELIRRHGLTFSNSFVNFPLCSPSRASFLTGQAAHNHGVTANPSEDGGYLAFRPREQNNLGVWLKNAGYVTGFVGKFVNGYSSSLTPILPGWDDWHVITSSGQGQYYDYKLAENGIVTSYGFEDASYSTDVFRQIATDFIARNSPNEAPFFLLLAPVAPHTPATPAPRHAGRFAALPFPFKPSFNEEDVSDKPDFVTLQPLFGPHRISNIEQNYRTRLETLLAVDEAVAQVVDALALANSLEDTIVIFTADNGFLSGEHRLTGKRPAYEESIRVPLMMRGPGIPQGETRSQLVNNLDVVATILELTGAVSGNPLDGRSLVPVIADPFAPWRTALLIEGLLKGPTFQSYVAIRTKTDIYIEYLDGTGNTETEYYDLALDEFQLRNVINDNRYADRLTELQDALDSLRSCVGESCWFAQ